MKPNKQKLTRLDLLAGVWVAGLVVASAVTVASWGTPEAAASINPRERVASGYLSPSDRDCLVRTVFGEVRGQGAKEIKEVTGVILRRQRMGQWGGTICEVVKSPRQFSAWNKGDPNRRIMLRKGVERTKNWKRVERIVLATVASGYVSKHDHYWHKEAMKAKKNPKWASACRVRSRIGAGTFCTIRS
jgi:spore germination cell wall hydrolase CwlJ-like protein